jgi:hypothetical protein
MRKEQEGEVKTITLDNYDKENMTWNIFGAIRAQIRYVRFSQTGLLTLRRSALLSFLPLLAKCVANP